MRIRFEEIRRRREQMMMTHEEAGIRAGWNAGDMSVAGRKRAMTRWNDVERGRYQDPRLGTIASVAVVLGCGLDDLVDLHAAGAPAEAASGKTAGKSAAKKTGKKPGKSGR